MYLTVSPRGFVVPTLHQLVRRYWKAFLSVLFLPVVGNAFASELRDLIYHLVGWKTDLGDYLWQTTAVNSVFFFGFALLTLFFGRELLRPRNVALGPNINPAAHPHVVLFLSNIRSNPNKFHDDCTPVGLPLG